MAFQKTYAEVCDNDHRFNLVLKVKNGSWIECEGYEGCYILDEDLPDGKYSYYCRHKETNLDLILSIKRDKGLTFNFWGCIVTDEPLDFGDADELIISRMINDTENYDVVMIFGSAATDAYCEGFKELKSVLDNGDGCLVHRTFHTEDERRAYLLGLEDQNGWEESEVMDAPFYYQHQKAISSLL